VFLPVVYEGISKGEWSIGLKSLDNQRSGGRALSCRRLWGCGGEAPSRWRKFAIL